MSGVFGCALYLPLDFLARPHMPAEAKLEIQSDCFQIIRIVGCSVPFIVVPCQVFTFLCFCVTCFGVLSFVFSVLHGH